MHCMNINYQRHMFNNFSINKFIKWSVVNENSRFQRPTESVYSFDTRCNWFVVTHCIRASLWLLGLATLTASAEGRFVWFVHDFLAPKGTTFPAFCQNELRICQAAAKRVAFHLNFLSFTESKMQKQCKANRFHRNGFASKRISQKK